MEKYVLHTFGQPRWGVSGNTEQEAIRAVLAYLNVPFNELTTDREASILFSHVRYGRKNEQIEIKLASPVRGTGKTAPERKLIGYRMGKHDKVYPASIFTPVYEEPPSTYVTRESAEKAIRLAALEGVGPYALAMLEAKPKERVKAGRE